MRRGVVGGGTLSLLEPSRRGLMGVVVKGSVALDFAFLVDLVVVFAFFLGEGGIVSGIQTNGLEV